MCGLQRGATAAKQGTNKELKQTLCALLILSGDPLTSREAFSSLKGSVGNGAAHISPLICNILCFLLYIKAVVFAGALHKACLLATARSCFVPPGAWEKKVHALAGQAAPCAGPVILPAGAGREGSLCGGAELSGAVPARRVQPRGGSSPAALAPRAACAGGCQHAWVPP